MRSLALNRVQRMSPPVTPRQQGGGWTSWVTGWGWGYYSQTAPTSPGPGTEDRRCVFNGFQKLDLKSQVVPVLDFGLFWNSLLGLL